MQLTEAQLMTRVPVWHALSELFTGREPPGLRLPMDGAEVKGVWFKSGRDLCDSG